MARENLRAALIATAMGTIGMSGCLPSDTRPPPAEVRFVAAPGDDPTGVSTSDGWTLSVEHLLIGIGGASFSHDCTLYSDTPYLRLLDGTRPGDQKISTMYALGTCPFDFRVGWPDEGTVLGEGITEEDLQRLGTTVTLPDDRQTRAGIGVELAITATKDASKKHLAWAFRQATTYDECRVMEGTKPVGIELASENELVLRVVLAATRIFASDSAYDAPLVFAPFAEADDTLGNQDDEITLDEIDGVSLTDAMRFGRYGLSQTIAVRTLRDYVFLQTLANVAHVEGGVTCSPHLGIREGRND